MAARPEVAVPVSIYVSQVIAAEPAALWEYVGPFDKLHAWNPAINTCTLEAGAHPQQIGAVRELRADGGDGHLREPLLAYSGALPRPHCTYGMHVLEAGDASLLPGQPYDYRATIELRPVTLAKPAATLLEFTATFVADPKDAIKLEGAITGIFSKAFASVQEHFA